MSHQISLETTRSQQPWPVFQSNQILSHQEAKSRLQRLTPGTEEYCKLQNALVRTASIVEISLPTETYKVDTFSKDCALPGGFGSSEHVAIGEAIKLKGLPEENTPLLIRGVCSVRFQHIVALAGDFYGVAGEAISLPGGTNEEKTERFKKAFGTLAEADNDELRRLILEIDHECMSVRHSSLPHHCYSSDLMVRSHALGKIKSDIDALLIDNSDHFSTNAEDVYRIGHALAIKTARNAGLARNTDLTSDATKEEALKMLKHAYALEAFACHFLTDLFAAGHIRNQRGELESFLISQLGFSQDMKAITPINAKKLAGILTAAEHEKDGNEGLNVSNKKGESWRAFGDGSFFTPKNAENKKKAINTTQQSVDEVYEAYLHPTVVKLSVIEELVPHATPFNPLPIYEVSSDGKSLFLHQGNVEIEVKSKLSYHTNAVAQALTHLPQTYIDGYITPHFKVHPLISQADHLIKRITGVFWEMIGISTYHQVWKLNQKLNEKIDEIADTLFATHHNTIKILEEIRDVRAELTQRFFIYDFQEVYDAIALIKDVYHQDKSHRATLDSAQLAEAEKRLIKAFVRLSRIFEDGKTTTGVNILATYEEKLKKSNPPLSDSEIKIAVTLFFHQMLDYQTHASSLYTIIRIRRCGHDKDQIQSHSAEFKSSIAKQLATNKNYIEEKLIGESRSYIELQLEKSKTKRLAFGSLNP